MLTDQRRDARRSIHRRTPRSRGVVEDLKTASRWTLYPIAPEALTYWYDNEPNFGDALNPWLLRRLGFIPRRASAVSAELFGIGSILEVMPAGSDAWVWGSGLIHGRPRAAPPRTLAVRGHLTHGMLGEPPVQALGDPGLLVSRFLRRPRVRHPLGVVPHLDHWGDADLRALVARTPGAILVDVTRSPGRVVRDIARCASVVTTSLHGLVVADAFRIPATWVLPEPVLVGGDFKFRDHESVMNPDGASRRSEVAQLLDGSHRPRAVSADVLTHTQDLLLASADTLRQELGSRQQRPFEALRRRLARAIPR